VRWPLSVLVILVCVGGCKPSSPAREVAEPAPAVEPASEPAPGATPAAKPEAKAAPAPSLEPISEQEVGDQLNA
jgi:hypothetical protein